MGDCPSTCRQSVARVPCRRMGHKKQDVAKMSFLRFKVNLKSLSSVLADDEFRDASPLAAVFFGRFFSLFFFSHHIGPQGKQANRFVCGTLWFVHDPALRRYHAPTPLPTGPLHGTERTRTARVPALPCALRL